MKMQRTKRFLTFIFTIVILGAAACTPPTADPIPVRETATAEPDPTSMAEEIQADCFQSATAFAWLDENGNGVQDEGERPLPGIHFLLEPSVDSRTISNEEGIADIFATPPGTECPEDQQIVANKYEGYTLTTPNPLPYEGPDAAYPFGFQLLPEAVQIVQSTVEVPISIDSSNPQALAAEAKTPMYFAVDNKLAAIIAVADPIKEDSIAAIKRLQHNGIRVVMLTGDNRATAKAVAKKAGIKEFFAEVLPEEKSKKVQELQMEGEVVGMTGDGINDAPALAIANVGFAIGTGTDVAIESADITLMRGSLHGLADAIAVSKATLRNIKQNLFGAFIYNVAGVPFAAGVLYPFFGLLLSPVIAGAAMAFSSLTVVTNANRLRFFKAQEH